ncbi:hypothetical protein [Burkholderia sp. GbtcB21]|uniref:hypothetical protein n=1 Tax=Burkholderia sp. GbtcB21 TaxID=2824766 RepID=UPI001C2F22B1|nr:hypothetical protein [Burkholderia sp. GbtcB21]
MGQAKSKRSQGFAQQQIEEWESRDCVDFAVGLARVSGWLLHVDWWTTSQQSHEGTEDGFKPIRVYVGDNKDLIFDPRGVMSLFDYRDRILVRQLRERGLSTSGGVLTRFYDEARFASLPVRYQPDEEKIRLAISEIETHPTFLAGISTRTPPHLPAYEAARFSFGLCTAYAEGLRDVNGLQPTGLLAVRFLPGFEGLNVSERGYFHSVALHPDGMGEDSWGKAPLSEIARRFGVSEYVTSEEEHHATIRSIKLESPDIYASKYSDAVSLIHEYTKR